MTDPAALFGATTSPAIATPDPSGKIVCHIDGVLVHSVQVHIARNHAADWTLERYQTEFPDAPLLSDKAVETLRKRRVVTGEASPVVPSRKRPMHEVFDLGAVPATRNKRGEATMISVVTVQDESLLELIPEVDPNYVYSIELLKNALIAMEFGMPLLLWGYHGTGKTSLAEQISARTGRPFMRAQHTINTEESHILGQMVVADGATKFQLGPLPIAMMQGLVYCADEYDVAVPSVLAVYQPVLEGKSLMIKDAPLEFRVIKPHPDFRFIATGNTNGMGDETGLYQGTQLQNAANYSRFGVTEEVAYMDPKIETLVIAGQARIEKQAAEKLVLFATNVRREFMGGKIGSTVSPRELINAGKIGLVKGNDFRSGIQLAFSNRLSRVDRKVVDDFAQRVFA